MSVKSKSKTGKAKSTIQSKLVRQFRKLGYEFKKEGKTYTCELPKCHSVLKISSFDIKEATGDFVDYSSKRTIEDMKSYKDELECSSCNAEISGNVYLTPMFPAWFDAYFGKQLCEMCANTTNYTKVADEFYTREPEINPIGKKIIMVLDSKNIDEYEKRAIHVYYKEETGVRCLIFSDGITQKDDGITGYTEKYVSFAAAVDELDHTIKMLTEYISK